MISLRKFLFCLILIGFSISVSATQYSANTGANRWFSSTAYACTWWGSNIPQGPFTGLYNSGSNKCEAYDNGIYAGFQTSVTSRADVACPSGQSLDDSTGLCAVPPVVCTAGEVGIVKVRTARHIAAGQSTLFPFDGTAVQQSTGCEYTYDPNGPKQCYRSLPADNGDWAEYCEVAGVKTGVKKTATTELPADGNALKSTTVSCGTGPGVTACYDQADCYQVNGIDVCGVSDTGATINGKSFAVGSEKNCGTVNGNYVCVESKGTSGIDLGRNSDDQAVGVSADVKSKTTQTQTTNPDGSVTTIRTTSTNVYGQQNVVTTTTTYPDGHSETTTEGGGTPGDDSPGSIQYGTGDGMPAITPFYEQKYPDGLAGVWAQKQDALTNNPLSDLVGNLTNGAPSSGASPEMGMSFNIMSNANYGQQSFGFDSEIWGYIRIILLVTTAFTCRRIIFGG